LLRLEARSACRGVAFAEEVADTIAEFGEGAVFVGFEITGHSLSISYCDIPDHFTIFVIPSDNPCVG
jgi:hypothetical protein